VHGDAAEIQQAWDIYYSVRILLNRLIFFLLIVQWLMTDIPALRQTTQTAECHRAAIRVAEIDGGP
jgi:hypothetical protein